MKFKLTVRWANRKTESSWHDAQTARDELAALSKLLDSLLVGETITIERVE